MKKFLLFMICFVATNAQAFVPNPNTVFYCKTKNHKQILVERKGDNLIYRFGKKLEAPEIILENGQIDTPRPVNDFGAREEIVAFIEFIHNGLVYRVDYDLIYKSGLVWAYRPIAEGRIEPITTVECRKKTKPYFNSSVWRRY